MASIAALYSPQMLALATSLASFPLDPGLPLRGSARAPTCGSTIDLGLAIDDGGRIARIGLRAHACAVGQAAAAIFAAGAPGRSCGELVTALDQLEGWLGGDAAMPAWPQFEAIAAARSYPARHGAMLLGWRAALDALGSAGKPR